jgi:regulator of replication initiation timing
MNLDFRVETIDGARVKVRDDGRRGYCVADEAALWDALQASEAALAACAAENEDLAARLEKALAENAVLAPQAKALREGVEGSRRFNDQEVLKRKAEKR